MRMVTFKIDEGLLRLLDQYARKYRISRSEAIRRAILLMLWHEGLLTSEELEKRNAEIPPRRVAL